MPDILAWGNLQVLFRNCLKLFLSFLIACAVQSELAGSSASKTHLFSKNDCGSASPVRPEPLSYYRNPRLS